MVTCECGIALKVNLEAAKEIARQIGTGIFPE